MEALAGGQMSMLFRYESDEHGLVAVKVRADSVARIGRCLQIQSIAVDAGFPCARPVTGAESLGQGLVVSAETWRSGGEMHVGGGLPFADRSAKLLARLAGILGSESPAGLGPPPPWMHWNPPNGGLWPPNPPIDAMDQDLVPVRVCSIAQSVAARLARSLLPAVVGHGDWESQNLRWEGTRPWAVHDWDSLVALPEAAIVGAASGAFASTVISTMATIEESEEFIDAYEQAKDKRFSNEEHEIAWAASLWPALHNARGESLFHSEPVALDALTRQAAERLRRAGAH
ncbi:hypothetical protein B5P43_17725 [Bacillus sp. SRB_336]|nr:hypothetical protein B5P43_17725 [Bacillus sp. SRB_336]